MAAPFDLLEAKRRIFRSSLGALAKLVGLAICDHWSLEAPEPFPSVARLERWTSLKRDAVMGAIETLAAANAVRVVKTLGRVNRYDLTPLMQLPVGETDQSARPTSRQDRPHQSAKPTPTSRPDRHEVSKGSNQPKEPSIGARTGAPTKDPKPQRAKRKAVEVPLPADFKPTDEHRALASQHGLQLELETVAFRGYYEGRTAASWNGRFSTWLANQAKWNRERGPRRPAEPQRGIATGIDASRMGTESALAQRMRAAAQPQQTLPLNGASRRAV